MFVKKAPIHTYCSYECSYKSKKKRDKYKRSRSDCSVNKLDALWATKVKDRDGNVCVYCGKTTYLNAHHIFSRSNKSTRWYLPNGITLCSGHHVLSSKFSAHKTPLEFIDFLTETKGDDFIDNLRRKANSVNNKTNEEWLEYLERNNY